MLRTSIRSSIWNPLGSGTTPDLATDACTSGLHSSWNHYVGGLGEIIGWAISKAVHAAILTSVVAAGQGIDVCILCHEYMLSGAVCAICGNWQPPSNFLGSAIRSTVGVPAVDNAAVNTTVDTTVDTTVNTTGVTSHAGVPARTVDAIILQTLRTNS